MTACDPVDEHVAVESDCDDSDPDVNPDAQAACNGLGDDCDGEVDEAQDSTWYPGADGDGYGDPEAALASCAQPTGALADATDCDDTDSPQAAEVCDDIDQDCTVWSGEFYLDEGKQVCGWDRA